MDQDADGEPDVGRLAQHIQTRLRELRLSVLAASKFGILSRSTLTALRDGSDRIPNYRTLTKLDDLLSWEPGSARTTLYGGRPTPREEGVYGGLPQALTSDDDGDHDESAVTLDHLFDDDDDPADWDYEHLVSCIERRLRELNMTKSKFAAIGGPSRSTLATLGTRGYVPTPETLERIDTFLLWERGSALTALRGGQPLRKGPSVAPHPALVPLNSLRDTLKAVKVRLNRQAQTVAQLHSDVDEALMRVNVAISELDDPARKAALVSSDSGTPGQGDAAGKGEIHD